LPRQSTSSSALRIHLKYSKIEHFVSVAEVPRPASRTEDDRCTASKERSTRSPSPGRRGTSSQQFRPMIAKLCRDRWGEFANCIYRCDGRVRLPSSVMAERGRPKLLVLAGAMKWKQSSVIACVPKWVRRKPRPGKIQSWNSPEVEFSEFVEAIGSMVYRPPDCVNLPPACH
jgi:hypothetical protein